MTAATVGQNLFSVTFSIRYLRRLVTKGCGSPIIKSKIFIVHKDNWTRQAQGKIRDAEVAWERGFLFAVSLREEAEVRGDVVAP